MSPSDSSPPRHHLSSPPRIPLENKQMMEKAGKVFKSSLKSSMDPARMITPITQPSPKSGKGTNASKSSLSKESQPLELKTDKELPENAKYLMDCEAFEILQGIKEQMVVLSEDPSLKLPVSFDRGLEYVKDGRYYINHQSVRQILQLLKKHGVSESEVLENI
ncbi:DNA-directed RNA polymerases IV and V subunit 4 [Raphanus sativus]|nr:DNA-directed RNA polymerases IV and V subunit 4 [Raphanus sativus]KAJ4884629.1 DNA-directed RNA polymerases IV and V subunit 4 [Raphanus sativus]